MHDFKQKRLGFIGGGNMGRAIVGGLLKSGFPAGQITVADPHAATREALENDFGVGVSDDNDRTAAWAEVLVLAVKPQQMASVVGAMRKGLAAGRPLLLSVAAGIRVAALRDWAGPGLAIVRSMPNRPALLGVGATGLYADRETTTAEQRALAEAVLAVTGSTVWVDTEAELDWVTALSGSGPAYFFLLAELLAKAAVKHGMSPQTAASLAAHTLHGAGSMAVSPGADLARLRAEVTSKGGTTFAALASFEADGLEKIVEAAVVAAATRSLELGDEFGKSVAGPKGGV
jgi:pyrroline-5-carboxylate reductase